VTVGGTSIVAPGPESPPEVALITALPGPTAVKFPGSAFATTVVGSLVVHVVEELSVISCVDLSLKVPTAWNWSVVSSGTMVGAGAGQAVSAGVGLGLMLPLGTGVGGAGVPGQIEILDRNGPGGAGVPQLPTGIPDVVTTQPELEPLPQLHDSAPATSIIAVPIRIQRAPPTIGNQL
jgi:hypothetical protein